nr:MAG TPA: hypothetical protein [Microviridae sp.]
MFHVELAKTRRDGGTSHSSLINSSYTHESYRCFRQTEW